ncbi:BfmA/BtgA family mobilization protein [Flavobacterium columnare]|uniref:BfmA/BtgA family mobilization protein n=1 Tax=Flavobacterium columnare TaxID=996 RepID=UPI0040333C05
MRQNKDIRLSGTLADRWETIQYRFGYSTNIKLIDDLMYFFETNPVSPRDRFDNLFTMLNYKIEEFNKDNNRVIAIVRNIEKVKLDPIIRSINTDISDDLRIIKKKLLLSDEFKTPTENNNKIQKEIEAKITAELTEKYENKLNEHRKSYAELNKNYDTVTLEHGTFYNRLKKLSSLYSVEKSTFGKNKIVFEMSESEFLELISLK